MMKLFHVREENEMLYQKALVDREIDELILSRRRFVNQFHLATCIASS